MSSGARIGLVLATVVVIVLAFVLASPGGDGEETPTKATTVTGPTTATGAINETAKVPPATPKPTYTKLTVKAGKPVGGVKTITVKKDDRARIEVSSPDTSAEIHLHGYDLSRDLKAGGRVRYVFDANAEGIFEIEVEDTHTQIGKLVVEP